jgi:hypothetical protein
LLILVTLTAFGLLGVLGYRLLRADALATLATLEGTAERDTAVQLHAWRPATPGDEFEVGDGARTADGAKARFELRGGASLVLNPASQIRFRSSEQGRLSIAVELGSAEVESGANALSISSEFGELVLEAGGALRLLREAGQLMVEVELGQLQLASRRYLAGQALTLEFGGIVVEPAPSVSAEPTPPMPVASAIDPSKRFDRGAGLDKAELSVRPGESFVVHDPSPPTAIGFSVDETCEGGARLRVGEQFTEGTGQLSLMFTKGNHDYELSCVAAPDRVVAKGNIRVLRDAGTRSLPTFTPSAEVTTDGRRYTVMYQHRLPRVTVSWPTAPAAPAYELKLGARTLRTTRPSYTFDGLPRGTHQVMFSADTQPARKSRATTIEVVYDTQAPPARLSEPSVVLGAANARTVTGQALPGWTVSVGGRPVALDPQQRFSVEVDGSATLPITLSHPRLGTHYYLRRSAQVQP